MMTVLIGDALEELKKLPSESVHCVVTSPPYWGLRDYSRCSCAVHSCSKGEPSVEGVGGNSMSPRPNPPNPNCPICRGTGIIEGVKEHQLGLEKTPEEYVKHLVEVFREVKRVLRDDGTLWLNLGDSYYGSWGNSGSREGGQRDVNEKCLDRTAWENHIERPGSSFTHELLKPKDLVGIPWRVAFALQADGWYLRSDIIWAKPNPMPESVTDRPTKSHEYIFLLTKSARYFYDQEAIREAVKPESLEREKYGWNEAFLGRHQSSPTEKRPHSDDHNGFTNPAGRNIRTVWEITTQPYPEAHFATFPEELPRRCIKAGTSQKGCCPKCGAPWKRIVEKESFCGSERGTNPSQFRANLQGPQQSNVSCKVQTLGWQPTCECGEAETTQCTVLDPFAGSGTTGQVAKELGRSAILIELNPVYDDMIRVRIGIGVKSGPLDAIAVGTEGE